MEEMIKTAVDTMLKQVPNANRDEVEKMFKNYFEKGIPFFKSMGIDEDFMKYLYGTAYQLFQSGKFSEALASFQMLSIYDPTDDKYVLGKALCYKEMQKYPNAINELIAYAGMREDDPQPYWHMYECFELMNEPWGAGSSLGAVIYLCNQNNSHPELKKRAEMALVKISAETEAFSNENNETNKK